MSGQFPCAAGAVTVILCTALLASQVMATEATAIEAVVQDEAGVPAATLARAQRVTESIFAKAGLRIAWLGGDRAACVRTLPVDAPARRAFLTSLYTIHILDRLAQVHQHLPPDTLGVAAPGTRMVTVFYVRVERHAREADEDPAIALGHVMAHELGHLLLARASHSIAGVMRSSLDMHLAAQGRVLFTDDEAVVMAKKAQQLALCR